MAVFVSRSASVLLLGLAMTVSATAADLWQSSQIVNKTFLNSAASDGIGGGGCREGQYIVGFEVRSGTLVDAISAECATLGPNGEHRNISQTRTLGNTGGGSPRLSRCPSGQVMTAVRARAGQFIDQVSFACRSWNATQGLHGPLRWQAKHGGSGGEPAGPIECPDNKAMIRLTGEAGSVISRFWVTCKTLPPTQPATTMSAQGSLDPQERPASSSPTSRPASIPQGITPATALPQSAAPIVNAPILKTLSSKPVAGGVEIMIDGEHFMTNERGRQTNQVTRVEIGGQSVPYRVVSPTRIAATVPQHVYTKLDRQRVPIVVTSGGQRVSKQLPLR